MHEAGWVTKYLQGWMEGRRLKYGEQVLGKWVDAWCIDNWVVWGMVVVNLGYGHSSCRCSPFLVTMKWCGLEGREITEAEAQWWCGTYTLGLTCLYQTFLLLALLLLNRPSYVVL